MLEYECCFCGLTVSSVEQSSPLDPCALILVGHFERPYEQQKEQEFFCHLECIRKAFKNDGTLYIAEPDFPTNAENED